MKANTVVPNKYIDNILEYGLLEAKIESYIEGSVIGALHKSLSQVQRISVVSPFFDV